MTPNYETIEGKRLYINEDNICTAVDITESPGYQMVTLANGLIYSVKPYAA